MTISYLLRRLGQSALVLIALLCLMFVVSNFIGDPVTLLLPPEAPHSQRVALAQELGLDKPWYGRFGDYVARIAAGDFGTSLWLNAPALPLVLTRLPFSLMLAAITLSIAVPTALILGSLAALRPKSVVDRMVNFFSLGSVSTVDFWIGLMLILIFAVQLGWFRSGGYGPSYHYVVLPALTMASRPVGRLAQVTRSAMIEEYSKPYIRMARAKGMPERRVFLHALKGASIPIVTLGGDEMNHQLNGSVVIETVFAWPGIGLLLIQAVQNRDFYLLEATVFVIAVIAIIINLLVDFTYTYLNPKIKYV